MVNELVREVRERAARYASGRVDSAYRSFARKVIELLDLIDTGTLADAIRAELAAEQAATWTREYAPMMRNGFVIDNWAEQDRDRLQNWNEKVATRLVTQWEEEK